MQSEKYHIKPKEIFKINLIYISTILALIIFVIDLQIPLGVAGGVPYIAVILLALFSRKKNIVIKHAVFCSLFILVGLYFSPEGGELWKVLSNRFLALFSVWITAILGLKWLHSEESVIKLIKDIDLEKEKIYLATMHGAQHITNNLLNELKVVEFEIKKHAGFDKEIVIMFDNMLIEADNLMSKLSEVNDIDEESIKKSIYPQSES